MIEQDLQLAIEFLKAHWVLTSIAVVMWGLFGDIIKDKLLG